MRRTNNQPGQWQPGLTILRIFTFQLKGLQMKNIVYAFILLTVAALCLVSCNSKPSGTIRIGILNGPSAVSFIQLIDNPPVIDGKRVEFIMKNEPMQIQALMMRNEIDFAILPTVMAANLYNKGVKYRMVACPIWGTLYLVSTSGKPGNLAGKTISVFGQSGTSDILLRHMLNQKNINGVKIDYTYSTNNEIGQALLNKKIEFGVISEPLVSILLAKDKSLKIVSKIECEDYVGNFQKDIFVQTAFLVNDKFSKNYPSQVIQVCEAYSASCNYTYEQPAKVAKLMVKHRISPTTQIAELSIPLCNIRYVGAFALEQEVNRYLNIFYEFNPESIGKKIPEDNFIYQTF